MPRRILCVALLGAAFCAAVAPLSAQQRRTVRVVEVATDNDAYDFWIPMNVRPDHEYTHGMWLALEADAAPGWGRRLGGGRKPCNVAAADEACLSTRLELGQKLYTPTVDGAEPVPGQRAYAGWLYTSATARITSPRASRTFALEAGVTGAPSLGEQVHTLFHRLAGFWKPVGWKNQLRFEPGVVARYDETRILWEGHARGTRVVELAPSWGASLGNVETAARAGVRLRAGYRLPRPWGDRGERKFALWGMAGVRQDWVGRDLFLDGNTFGDRGVHVKRRPFVAQSELGGGFRLGAMTAEYRVTTRGRDYETQSGRHPYSSITLRFDRAQ